jgi:methylaspartate mutase epsilon subunit
MLVEQDVQIDGIDAEQDFIERSTRALLDVILERGEGDVAQGTIRAFETGELDVPFAPSESAAGNVLPARDDDGRVRILAFGDLALPEDVREVHRSKLDARAKTEGREPSFKMVADDVDAISEGRLIGRPNTGGRNPAASGGDD